jgi:alginate O-acetyltransferase complex protein AlgI
MLFNSVEFAVFLAVVLGLYWLPPVARVLGAWQWGVLAVASFVFYAWDDPKLLILLCGSILFNFGVGRAMARKLAGGGTVPRGLLAFGVAANLVLLAAFKYAGLFGELLFPGEGRAELRASLHAIPLPVGISFYTFHAISFLVDLSRAGGAEPKLVPFAEELAGRGLLRPLGKLALYINFFPQLVAGPIMKAREFLPQIGPRELRDIPWRVALRYLITGFFLKMVVADNLREHTDLIGTTNVLWMKKLDLVGMLYGYSFRIFADFAGYSLIALGLAALCGYRLPVNFNYPYVSASVTEFWRRWHISLSNWLRDYLYFPLGGNRKGSGRTYFNLFLVMLLGGLWHGAAWRFALWGAAHGVLLAVERLLGVQAGESSAAQRSWRQFGRIILTFHLVSLVWLLFAMPDLESLRRYLGALWDAPMGMRGRATFLVGVYGLPVVLYHLWGYFRPVAAGGARWRRVGEPLVFGLMLYLTLVNAGVGGSFIYFQF